MKLPRHTALFFLILFAPASGFSQSARRLKENALFFLQRNLDANTIYYLLNLGDDGKPDPEEPVSAYWVKYTDKGRVQPLSKLQKKHAYGIKVKSSDPNRNSYVLNFVSFGKRDIQLIKMGNLYRAYITINGTTTVLNKIWVQIEGGSLFSPLVKYIEITGTEGHGRVLSERVIP